MTLESQNVYAVTANHVIGSQRSAYFSSVQERFYFGAGTIASKPRPCPYNMKHCLTNSTYRCKKCSVAVKIRQMRFRPGLQRTGSRVTMFPFPLVPLGEIPLPYHNPLILLPSALATWRGLDVMGTLLPKYFFYSVSGKKVLLYFRL